MGKVGDKRKMNNDVIPLNEIGKIGTVKVYNQAYVDNQQKRIEELETRYTELFLQNNEFTERFAKSIEIIKSLLSCCRNYPQENAEKMEQAKRFLKEIEK